MYSQKPGLADEFEKETAKGAELPEHVKSGNTISRMARKRRKK